MKKVLAVLLVGFIFTGLYAQQRTNQQKQFNKIGFDRTVLLAIQSLENNYSVRDRLLPNVNVNDYYQTVLRTAKRLALADPKLFSPEIKQEKKEKTPKPKDEK